MEVAFPEMEKQYIQAAVKQNGVLSEVNIPNTEVLTVQGECLANQEKAKAI